MAITSKSSNAERKETKKAMIKNLTWIGVYLAFLFLAGVELKQRHDWFHTWWYLFISSLGGTFVIFAICRLLRGEYCYEYKYIQLCVLFRAAFSITILLFVYSFLVVSLGLKILGTAFTVLIFIMLFLRFLNYFKNAYGLIKGEFDFLRL